MHPFAQLPAFDHESRHLHVMIDPPKGRRTQFAWDEQRRLFALGGVLPVGAVFP